MATVVIVLVVIAALVALTLFQAVNVVSQGTVAVIERFGRYTRTLSPGLRLLMPFVDKVRAVIDVREQVVPFSRAAAPSWRSPVPTISTRSASPASSRAC